MIFVLSLIVRGRMPVVGTRTQPQQRPSSRCCSYPMHPSNSFAALQLPQLLPPCCCNRFVFSHPFYCTIMLLCQRDTYWRIAISFANNIQISSFFGRARSIHLIIEERKPEVLIYQQMNALISIAEWRMCSEDFSSPYYHTAELELHIAVGSVLYAAGRSTVGAGVVLVLLLVLVLQFLLRLLPTLPALTFIRDFTCILSRFVALNVNRRP